LPADLAARAADPLAWRQTLAQLNRQSLARIDHRGLQIHRLTQAILRDRLTSAQATTIRACTEAILCVSHPGSSDDPSTWPAWARLMPHLLAADLIATTNCELRQLACDASAYLVGRGDARTGYDLTTRVYQPWRQRLGDDDPHTLSIGNCRAWALRLMRRYAEARDLDRDILAHRRRVLGEDHPSTLEAANCLAEDLRALGEVQAALNLDQDTLIRRRQVLGEDHPDTLASASNLATDLHALSAEEPSG
jgi:hypothetical protein